MFTGEPNVKVLRKGRNNMRKTGSVRKSSILILLIMFALIFGARGVSASEVQPAETTDAVTPAADAVTPTPEETSKTPSLSIGKKKLTLYTGENYEFPIEMTGASKKISWKLSKDGIVKLNKKKKTVKAIAPGKVTVTVKANKITKKCKITVKKTSLKLNKKTLTLYPDSKKSKRKLKAKVVGRSKKVKWKSSNTKYATVDENGVITVLKTGKTVKITATANKKKAVCKVSLRERPLLKIEKSKLTMKARTKKKLVLLKQGIDEKAEWTSSNPEVATVSQKGKITALKAGKTNITVTAGKYKSVCKLKVKENPLVKKVKLVTETEDDYEMNTVVGYDENGDEVWTYDAEGGLAGEHHYVKISVGKDYVYVIGMTNYVRLDKQTGKRLTRAKIGLDGTPMIFMDEEESMYIIGAQDDDLYKIKKSGSLAWKVKLDPDFMWPCDLKEDQSGVLKISDDSETRFTCVYVDMDDGDILGYDIA